MWGFIIRWTHGRNSLQFGMLMCSGELLNALQFDRAPLISWSRCNVEFVKWDQCRLWLFPWKWLIWIAINTNLRAIQCRVILNNEKNWDIMLMWWNYHTKDNQWDNHENIFNEHSWLYHINGLGMLAGQHVHRYPVYETYHTHNLIYYRLYVKYKLAF